LSKSKTANASGNAVQILQVCQNHARDTPLRGIYIPHFDEILVKISVLGSYALIVAPMGVKFGTEEGTSVPNFTSIGATCRPCGAKNLKICL